MSRLPRRTLAEDEAAARRLLHQECDERLTVVVAERDQARAERDDMEKAAGNNYALGLLALEQAQKERDAALRRAEAAEAEYLKLRNAESWMTTCTGCAKALDGMYDQTLRAEQAERRADALAGQVTMLRKALVETLIPLEAIWMVYHSDARTFAPESKAEIRNGLEKGREAIAATAPSEGGEGETE